MGTLLVTLFQGNPLMSKLPFFADHPIAHLVGAVALLAFAGSAQADLAAARCSTALLDFSPGTTTATEGVDPLVISESWLTVTPNATRPGW